MGGGGGKWGRWGREVGGKGEGTGNVVPPVHPLIKALGLHCGFRHEDVSCFSYLDHVTPVVWPLIGWLI